MRCVNSSVDQVLFLGVGARSFSEPTVRSKNMQSPGVRNSTREPISHPFLCCCFACGSRRRAQRETLGPPERKYINTGNWEGCGQKRPIFAALCRAARARSTRADRFSKPPLPIEINEHHRDRQGHECAGYHAPCGLLLQGRCKFIPKKPVITTSGTAKVP